MKKPKLILTKKPKSKLVLTKKKTDNRRVSPRRLA